MSNKVNIKCAKVRKEAIIPSKIVENAAFDIYACFEDEGFVIKPHETKLVPTGIATAMDSGYGLVLRERGSTGSKGMGLRAGVVDAGYRGEIFVGITNHNTKPLIITKATEDAQLEELSHDYLVYPYTKAIAQGLIVPIPEVEIEEISYEELRKIPSVRGVGCLGSSGK